jgi:ribosome-associated toxin RatA of RatAB toxin-antitoxin module
MKELRGSASRQVDASRAACFALLADVERYPDWYPQTVQIVRAIERDATGQVSKARAKLHVSYGPLVRDFDLLLTVQLGPPESVKLIRIPHEPGDPERFEAAWRVLAGPRTTIELRLDAALSLPRLVPIGGMADELARGFVAAAGGAL